MKTLKFSSGNIQANCYDCNFVAKLKNAHGLAAKHHYKTGHTINIKTQRSHTMTLENSKWHKRWEKSQ